MSGARLAIVVALLASVAPVAAQPSATPPAMPTATPAVILRASNEAAIAGDWPRVAREIDPLLAHALEPADLAEAHRLAGLAAFFLEHRGDAEAHFLAYLRLDLDGRLDPALVPPEVVTFFEDVRARHASELRSRRPRARKSLVLTLVPYVAQRQNGEPTKGVVIAGSLGVLIAGNVTSYLLLRRWCSRTGFTCDEGGDHVHGAQIARAVNIATGIGALITYAYSVYDGVHGYRRAYVAPTTDGAVIGLAGAF